MRVRMGVTAQGQPACGAVELRVKGLDLGPNSAIILTAAGCELATFWSPAQGSKPHTHMASMFSTNKRPNKSPSLVSPQSNHGLRRAPSPSRSSTDVGGTNAGSHADNAFHWPMAAKCI